MKRAVLSSVLMALFLLTIAQVPESFNYQVVVRDGTSNNPLTNQDVSFRMSILKGNSSGESQYSELHSANTGALGIVNLVIGNGTDKTGNITTIDWGADTYFLKVEIDKTGGSSYVEMGTTQLLSVPYALYSKKAGNTFSGNYNDLINKPLLFDGAWGSLSGKPITITGFGITDFDFTNAETNDLLKFNGSNWVKFTPDYLNAEVDGSVTNEIQTLSIENDVISLSDGGSVKLPNASGQYFYGDRDNDDYGNALFPVWVPTSVTPPSGFTLTADDCNDDNPEINPGTTENCFDGIDNNCNGLIDCADGDCSSSNSCGPVDILFLIDNTSDMSGGIATLKVTIMNVIYQLAASIADMAVGLAAYQDFPVSPFGSVSDIPYSLRKSMVHLVSVTDYNSFQNSLNALNASGGMDQPESGNEALYQVATGSGLSGSWGAIPPSSVGFRTGSARIVIVITNSEFHNASDYPFTSNGQTAALAQLTTNEIKVMGIRAGTNLNARQVLETYAIQTGATIPPSSGSGTCPTGLEGSPNSPIGGVCPLVYDVYSDCSGLGNEIIDGILLLLSQQ